MSVKILGIPKLIKGRNWLSSLGASARRFRGSSSRYLLDVDASPTKYGGKTNVTILPGVGVGPEIMESTLKVLEAAEAPLSFEILPLNDHEDSGGDFENALTSIRRNRVALKGNIELRSKNPYAESRNVVLRKTLDLSVYVLYCKTYQGLTNKFGDFDITVFRQNTEGEYLMLEHEPTPGSVESLKVVTRFSSVKVSEFTFDYAVKNGKRKITIVHSSDVHPYSEGLFVQAALDVAKKYPSIKVNVMEVGVAVIKIAESPRKFDIILATNLNGGMVSHFLVGMLGGPGLGSGTNFGEDGIAVFEPGARNKGMSIVGTGIANPLAMIMASVKLLNHLGYHKTANTVQESIFSTLVYDKIRTQDLGGQATTKEITDAVISHVRKLVRPKMGLISRHPKQHDRWKEYCPVPDDFSVKKK